MRKKIVAGNWKMNCSLFEGRKLASEVIYMVQTEVRNDAEIILIPPFIHTTGIKKLIGSIKNVHVGAQNCHQENSGAYTGEISADMLNSCGVEFITIGHSERREHFNEGDELLAQKAKQVLYHGMTPIFCCGERLEAREAGNHELIVADQVRKALFELSHSEVKNIIIAYEPVWAIGTCKTATADQAQGMHKFIRSAIAHKYSEKIANEIPILYGGSVKPKNAQDIFSQPDVDGGLIGGASLKSRHFMEIIKAL